MNRKGFTLVELIVGMGLVSIFALAALTFLVSQMKVGTTQRRISEAQTSMEATMNLIRWDIMMAGFGTNQGIVPHSGGNPSNVSIDPDELEINSFNSPVGGSGHWSYLVEDAIGSSDIFVKRWENDIFSNLSTGDSVILFNVAKVKLGEAAVLNTQFIASDRMKIGLSKPISAAKGTLIFALPADGATSIIYNVSNGILYRNGVVLQENIEDLQVSYWIDQNNNDIQDPGEWLPSFNSSDISKLKLVRVSIVKRTGPYNDYNESGKTYTVEDDIYTVPSSFANFRRQIYTVTVKPRNLGV